MPNLVNGLGGSAGFGEGILAPNDDGSTGAIDITSIFGPGGLNFFGNNYTSLFVNNNGNLTFASPTYQYTPSPIGTGLGFPIIAALWTDIDTRSGAQTPSPGGTSTGSDLVYYDVDPITHTFTATWDDVDYYSYQRGHPNAFQIQLISTGGGNFDIVFNYESITGDSGYYISTARAGYSPGVNGQGQQIPGSFELPGSPGQIVNIATNPGNTGVPGYYLFHVVGGQVTQGETSSPTPDPNPVSFSASVETHYEGDSGITPFLATIIRTGRDLSESSTVDWRIVVDDPDDLAPGQALSGQVTFAPNQTEATVEIGVAGDTIYEPSEFLQINLTHATFGALSWDTNITGTGIILNDDARTSFAFAGPVIRPEGQAGSTPFDFLVVRSGDVSHSSSVHWTLTNGTTDAQDFAASQPLSGNVTFAAGEKQAVIEIQVAGDRVVEPDETFFVNLTSATNQTDDAPIISILHATTMGAILDDDSRQTVLVGSPTRLVAPEGNSGLTAFNFTVMRVGDVTAGADIGYTITLPAVGGASASDLATPLTGVISFAAGSWQTVLTVQVHGNVIPEPDKTFEVTLGGGAYNTLTLSGLIMNDDQMVASSPSGSAALIAAGLPDASAFMQQLAGGGLWSAGDLL